MALEDVDLLVERFLELPPDEQMRLVALHGHVVDRAGAKALRAELGLPPLPKAPKPKPGARRARR